MASENANNHNRISVLTLVAAAFVLKGIDDVQTDTDLDDLIINSVSSALNIESIVVDTLNVQKERLS